MSKYRPGLGKLRLKELWQKDTEDDQGKVRIVIRNESREELQGRVLEFLQQNGASTPKQISAKLRLDVMQTIRLPGFLSELETQGMLSKRNVGSEAFYETKIQRPRRASLDERD
jgi:hypothetical protein